MDDLCKAFDGFIVEACRLRKQYKSRITLLIGLETEYITTESLLHVKTLLHRHSDIIDLVVGSVHHVHSIPIDFDRATFDRAVAAQAGDDHASRLQNCFCAYLDAQYDLLTSLRPEVIGHFDLCRLYTPNADLHNRAETWQRVKRNVEFAIDYGALFEVNASAFRKGWTSAYPGPDVLEVSMVSVHR